MKIRNYLAILLLIIGLSQMVGYLIGSRTLRGIGAASGIAPFPKVFCASDGYEGFAATFLLKGEYPNGRRWSRAIDPEYYAQLRGPYNRRNVYGAALAYAPRLPDALRDALLSEALAPDSNLRRELEIPADLKNIRVIILPRPGESRAEYIFTAPITSTQPNS